MRDDVGNEMKICDNLSCVWTFSVLGAKLESEVLKDYIWTVLSDKPRDQGIDGTHWTCDDVDSMVCYVIDDGGFLVASNQVDNDTITEVGYFYNNNLKISRAPYSMNWNMLKALTNNKNNVQINKNNVQRTMYKQSTQTSTMKRAYPKISVTQLLYKHVHVWEGVGV